MVWPIRANPILPIHFWPICFRVVLGCVVGVGVCVVVGFGPSGSPLALDTLCAGPPHAGPPKISKIFFLPSVISLFLLSLGGLLVEFWCESRDPKMCMFVLSGCRVKPRGPPGFHTNSFGLAMTHTDPDGGQKLAGPKPRHTARICTAP